MEQTSVSERIAQMVQHFTKGNKSAFAKTVGISNQSLGEIVGARQSAPSFTALQKMLEAFPQVRIEWLVMGRGSMLTETPEADATPFLPDEVYEKIERKRQQDREHLNTLIDVLIKRDPTLGNELRGLVFDEE
jgi:hypothetical protein